VHLSEYRADQGKRDRRTNRSYHGTKREIHQTDLAAAPPTERAIAPRPEPSPPDRPGSPG
jgi:hypothetical protein